MLTCARKVGTAPFDGGVVFFVSYSKKRKRKKKGKRVDPDVT